MMGVPREDDVQRALRQTQQGLLAAPYPAGQVVRHFAEIEALVRGDLVVSAAARVQLAAHGSRLLDQAFLHGHVDVFQVPGQRVGAAFDLAFDLAQRLFDHPALFAGKHTDAYQPAGVGDAAPDVHAEKTAVHVDRRVEIVHQLLECVVPAACHGSPVQFNAILFAGGSLRRRELTAAPPTHGYLTAAPPTHGISPRVQHPADDPQRFVHVLLFQYQGRRATEHVFRRPFP